MITTHKSLKDDENDNDDVIDCVRNLFEEIQESILDTFPHFVSKESINKLKLSFLNQKRIVRNQLYFKFQEITDEILKQQNICRCEVSNVCEIMDHMQEADFSSIVMGPNLSNHYPQLASARRSFVMWILKCQLIFRAQHDTFQQAVVIFDQYMLRHNILDCDSYLKLAIVSFFISCKMEEIEMPDINNLLKLADYKFSLEEIFEYEIKILAAIDYGVMIHAPVKYLQMIIMLDTNAGKFPFMYEFSKVLIDLCVLHSDLSSYPCCFIAATAYCVSQYMVSESELNYKLWNKHQMFLTGILWQDIEYMCYRLKKLIHNEFNDIWIFLNEKVSLGSLRTYSWLYLKEMCNPSRLLESKEPSSIFI